MPTEPVLGTETGGPGLAFGLNGISDWGPAQAFLNVFKTARDWTGHLPGQWGGVDVDGMTAQGVLDENGYPTRMPDDVTHLQTFVMTELPAEATYAAGRYRLTYDGTGELTIDWGASNVTYDDGEIWFDYTPNGDNMLAISIRATDTSGTGDHLRNIELVKEEHIPAYDAGETFNPLWLDLVDDVHALRFMDWMSTNNSTVVSWDDRPTPDMYSYDSGVPVEIMVELANQTSAEPWFNIPHNADDDYIRQFAQYVRDNLDPDLRAHFEFSNEVWNFTFGQARDSAADAEIRFGGEVEAGWVQEYGARSAEMAMILDEVYAGEEDRLVKTIATHTGWPGLESAILEAPAYVALDPANAAPYTLFDTYAVTGYFGYGLGANKAEAVLSWIAESRTQAETQADTLGLAGAERSAYVEAHKFDLATDRAIQELRDGSVTGDPSSSLAELFDTFDYHAAVAEAHGLDMVMYEGGTHVVATGQYTGNPLLSEFFIELNYSDAMGQLYTELLDGWVDAGGTLFNAFVEVAKPSQWGSWGSLRHLGDDTARHDALVEFLDTYPRLDRGGEVVAPDPVTHPVDPTPDPDPVPDPVDPTPDPDPVPDPVDPVPDPVTDPDPQTGGKAVREYIFGHSLINHVSDTPATVVPWWMDAFAEASGDNSYAFSGQWGGLQNHDDLPLRPQWGLNGVENAWDDDAGQSLADADFTHFTITALNFVQYQGPDQAYWNEPNTTPISATLDIIDHVIGQEPDATILIYENWPDMARFVANFPPTRAEFDTWCDYLRGEFNDWWVTYETALSDARPDVDIRLVTVGPMLADMLQSPDLGLADIPLTDLFVDDAPHGTASLYFLASIVQYTALYGELPPADFAVPDGVHPDIAAAFPEILTFVAENAGLLAGDPGVDEPPVVAPDPVTDPVDPTPDPDPMPDPVDPTPDPDPVPDPVDPVPDPVTDPDPQTGGKAVREYIFGHSLINHVSDTPATVVPWWMDAFAEASGDNSYAFSGQWGGLQNHDDLPLRPQWGLNGVENAWDDDAGQSLADADFTHFTITALNFVQYQGPDQAYWNEPNTTPISATLDIIDHVIGQEPDATILIYENWPDMDRFIDSFPPTRAEFDTWCDYLRGEFNDWWVTYETALSDARPDVDIRLVPVGPMLADMLQSPDLGLADIPLTDLFVDDAPHGTASLYFLASIVQYTALYGELPPADFAVPDGVHPDIAAAFPEILTFVAENAGLLSGDPGVDESAVIETAQNTPVTFDLLADDDQAVLIDAVKDEPDHGSITLNPTGTLTYTPNAFWFGTDSFTYEYIDLSGETVTADASVTVQGPEGHVIGDVQLDTAGTKPWSERFLTYDAAGDKVAVTVTRDDGTVVHTAFANDVRTTVEMLDPDDAVSWTRVQKEYDASGAVTHQTVHHDDGRIVATDLADGVRSISMMTDSSDAFSWGSQTQVYDSSGALTSRKRVMDNGVEHVSTFEDGIKVREVSEDLSDVFVWTRTISDYEASGTVSHRTKTYDDGRLLEIDYVDGIRTEMVMTDVLDAYDWTSRNFVFDAAGDLVTQSTIMDGF